MTDDARDRIAGFGAVELLVVVVEHRHLAHSQHRCGGAQLRLTDYRQRHRARMPGIAGRMAAVAAAVAGRRGQQKDLDPFGCVFGERATHAQRLIVGMGEDGHQSLSVHGIVLQRFRASRIFAR